MPDLPISGSKGNVTFVSGFAQSPFSWEARIAGLVRETTPFQPTNGYRTFASANLMGMKGSYKCRQTVNATAAITGPAYLANPFAFTLRMGCNAEQLHATKFGDTWRNYVSVNVLKFIEVDFQVYVEDTTALPLPLTVATGVFTIATGLSYSVPLIICDDITIGVHVDGSSRMARIPWKATANPTLTGSPPEGGATGAATLIADSGGRQFSGNIVVTTAEIGVNRDQPDAEWNIGFLGLGAITAA